MSSKNIVRGAITNGELWLFLILYMDADGGARESPIISLMRGMDPLLDLVAAVVARWVSHSFVYMLTHIDLHDRFSMVTMHLTMMIGSLRPRNIASHSRSSLADP